MKAGRNKMNKTKSSFRNLFLYLLLICFSTFSFADEELKINRPALDQNASKKILILNSYHQGHPWTDGVTQSILKRFSEQDMNVEIHIQNMDTKRMREKDEWSEFLKSRLDAYPQDYLDLMIVSDDNALSSLYELGHDYHNIPVVYCGITADIARKSDTCSMFVGVEENLSFKENIELGLNLFPETEHIAFVMDRTRTGASHRYAILQALKELEPIEQEIIWLEGFDGRSTADFIEDLQTLPENSIVIFSLWQVDGTGRFWDPVKYYPLYSDVCNAPIISVMDVGIDNAFLGGKVTSPETQGRLAADLGIQILYGELLENIKRVPDQNKYVFNWDEMNRWNIKIKDLPKGSEIVNKPLSVYNEFRSFFFITLGLIIIMFVLFWLLLLYHFRYRNFEAQRTKMAAETKILANRYNILFEQSNSAIVIFDLTNSTVVSFNDRALDLFEVPKEKFLNYPLDNYFPNYEELRNNLQELLQEPFEMTMYKNDYSTFEAQVILSQLQEGDSSYAYAIINDITLKKEQEKEIKVSKERLNEALLYSKNSYWEWDLVNNVLIKDNSFWLALDIDPTSLKEDPLDSDYYLNSVHPEDQAAFIEQVNDAIAGKRDTILSEVRMCTFDKVTWVEVRGVIGKRDEEGKGLVINGFMMNIDKRKQQEAELIKAKEKAEESDRLKSAFISNISHEIRTPLNGIVGFSNLLGRENLSIEDKRKYLSFINENNDLLLKLINDILEISRIETDTLTISEESVNMKVLCENLIAQESIHLSPVVSLELEEVQNINVQVDKLRLTQVLNNLLSNAIKFTDQGKIELGYHIRRDMLEFYVRDTGIGISEDMHEKVFERFVQVDPFSTGTGLGLPIAKALVEKMGGRIWLESNLGGGSIFYFTVKYKKASIDINDVEPSALKKKEESIEDRITVLIAEDDESNFVLLNVILTGKYKIIRVLETKEILIHLDRYEPKILIADTDMTGFDKELIESIRKRENKIPIIGISDITLDNDISRELIDMLDAHLTKPINIKSLLSILDEKLS